MKNVSQLRFKGFNDAWQSKNLFDYINRIIDFRGRMPKKLGMDWNENGTYLALSALNVKQGYVDKTINTHKGDKVLYHRWMNNKELHKGQILFTTEAPMENVAQIPDDNKYILSQRVIAFVVNKNLITDNFLSLLLSIYPIN